jgi:hypothetical protein
MGLRKLFIIPLFVFVSSAKILPYFSHQVSPFGLDDIANASPVNYAVCWTDFDGDGDLDIMINVEDYALSQNNFFYLENDGNASSPNYKANISNPFSLSTLPYILNLEASLVLTSMEMVMRTCCFRLA